MCVCVCVCIRDRGRTVLVKARTDREANQWGPHQVDTNPPRQTGTSVDDLDLNPGNKGGLWPD